MQGREHIGRRREVFGFGSKSFAWFRNTSHNKQALLRQIVENCRKPDYIAASLKQIRLQLSERRQFAGGSSALERFQEDAPTLPVDRGRYAQDASFAGPIGDDLGLEIGVGSVQTERRSSLGPHKKRTKGPMVQQFANDFEFSITVWSAAPQAKLLVCDVQSHQAVLRKLRFVLQALSGPMVYVRTLQREGSRACVSYEVEFKLEPHPTRQPNPDTTDSHIVETCILRPLHIILKPLLGCLDVEFRWRGSCEHLCVER